MYSFKEKKTHFVALRNPDVAQHDLELLAKEVPGFPQLATFSRNPKRYADDILYALLDCATREKIREYRRAMIAKEAEDVGEKKTKGPATKKTAEKKQKMPEGETTHTEETGPHDDVEKPEAAPADNSAEELKQALEEAEARAEEAEQRADEAEEARDEAEARAQETEQALEEEKKKEPAKETPEKSKNKRNTRKSTGTTSSTHKSK
jgi:hypothetical protein